MNDRDDSDVVVQMRIAFISSSRCLAAVIAEAIKVNNKPFKFILPFKVAVYQLANAND